MTTNIRKLTRILLAGNDREDVRRGVCAYARKAGWLVVTSEGPHGLPEMEVRSWDVAGILVTVFHGLRDEWLNTRVPVVGLGSLKTAGGNVIPDDRAYGRLVAEHFLQEQFEHFAYCRAACVEWINRQCAGFEERIREAGKQFHLLDWAAVLPARPLPDPPAFRRWLAGELVKLPKPLGLMMDSDWAAADALESCIEAGLAVPEEVAIVGTGDNVDICEAAPVPLSSVRSDGYRQGYLAAELLHGVMSNSKHDRPQIMIPPAGLTIRQSSNITAIPHLPTAKALRYIWEHMGDHDLSPTRVADAVGVCRKTLDRYAIQYLDKSVAEAISSARLTQATMLLAGSNKTVTQVARETGFAAPLQLRRTFARAYGQPLHLWRKQAQVEGVQAGDQKPESGIRIGKGL